MSTPSTHRVLRALLVAGLAGLLHVSAASAQSGDRHAPGRGVTKSFEIAYLRFIIDHHFSALRMTELAVGTDAEREAALDPDEGTAPSPGFDTTEGKATLEPLKALARRNNRVQREEIKEAQRMLRDLYGIEHEPQLTSAGRQAIAALEKAAPGEAFDAMFIEVFSRHHYTALQSSTQCLVGRDPGHTELASYCRAIVNAELEDIEQMRHLHCDMFGVCDYQPFGGVRGRVSIPTFEAPRFDALR